MQSIKNGKKEDQLENYKEELYFACQNLVTYD
jgi:hypothetical protein